MENSRASNTEGEELNEFLTKLQKVLANFGVTNFKLEKGETPFTIVLDDPLARSWIEFTEISRDEPSIITEEYQRTRAQDEEYDLEHEIKYPFITDGEFEIPPFEVAHEDGLPFKQYQALYILTFIFSE